jgi:hypothetical protein
LSVLVSKYVELAISTALTALLLTVIIFFVNIGGSASTAFQREQDSQFRLQEFAKYAEYDNTVVSGADAIACIYRFASSSTVPILQRNVRVFVRGVERFSNESIATLETAINPINNFNATLQINANGAVEAIRFN